MVIVTVLLKEERTPAAGVAANVYVRAKLDSFKREIPVTRSASEVDKLTAPALELPVGAASDNERVVPEGIAESIEPVIFLFDSLVVIA